MTRTDRHGMRGYHEVPLALFTALASAGSGIGVANLLHGLLGWGVLIPTPGITLLVGTFLVLGLLTSLGHLGRPTRGYLALRRVGRSPLSNEVLAVGLATTAALVATVLPVETPVRSGLAMAAILLGIPVLLAVGSVYRLPGHPTWLGLAPYHPLLLGLGFGLMILTGRLPEGSQARGEVLVLGTLILDALFVWDRARRTTEAEKKGIPVHAWLMAQRASATTLRVLLGILLPAVSVLTGWREMATLSLFSNLFLDRFLFYGLAVRVNTEAEVMRAETALEAAVASSSEPSPRFDEH